MKKNTIQILLLCLGVLLIQACNEKEIQNGKAKTLTILSEYDSIAANNFGADENGMKKYVMAFLRKGPNRDLPKAKEDSLQMAHLSNIGRMAEEGQLVLAGPFFGNGDLRGIYVFDVRTIEEAEKLTNTDPAIKAGSLVMELKEWYGTAALIAINDIHKSVSKVQE